MTVADYRRTPEGPPWYQLIEGTLIQEPSASSAHQTILFNLTLVLGAYLQSHRIGKILFAPMDVYLSSENVFQPDLIYVSNHRRAIIERDGLHAAPDLAVEIFSPSSVRRDRTQKLRVYGKAGTAECWLVDPETKTLEIYDFKSNPLRPTRTVSIPDSFTSRLFPGLVIAAAEVFDDL